jgi:hypothetical protein
VAAEPLIIRASVVILGVVVLTCAGLILPPLRTVVLNAWQTSAPDVQSGAQRQSGSNAR